MTASAAAPTPAAAAPGGSWHGPTAAAVTVHGYVLTGGLFYLGTPPAAAYRSGPEPAAIDPALPIRRVRLDSETPGDDARTGYDELTPGARAAYLEWMAGGRVGPTPTAHLWLFLAGLERRVLHDLAGRPDGLTDYAAISAELEALQRRYPAAAAFCAQAADFADVVQALHALADPALTPPTTPGVTPRLVAGIGRYLAAGQPLPAGWIYPWYAPGSTVDRDEFLADCQRRFPSGLAVPQPPAQLALTYRPASAGFAGRTVTLTTQVPDVRTLPMSAHTLLGLPDPAALDGPAAAVCALVRLIVLAGADEELLGVVCRHLYDVHRLAPAVRAQVDGVLTQFATALPDPATVQQRYRALADPEQDAVAGLLIATASIDAVVEPDHAQLLAAAFDVLGPGEPDLCRRLRALEVAAVVSETDRADATATMLDEAMVADTMAQATSLAVMVDALLAH